MPSVRRARPVLVISVWLSHSMNERRIGCGRRRSVEACSHQKPAQDEGDTGEDSAVGPSGKGLRSEQDTGRVEKPNACSNC